jgi:hypothetical protein
MTITENSIVGLELPPPQLHKFSLKLESTQKGVRLHVHCYGDTSEEVRKNAISCFLDAENDLREKHIPIAKMEVAP